MSCLFSFSHCSWGSQGKNLKWLCHSLLQWTMFCQNCQLWLIFIVVPQKPMQNCKTIILQFKIKQNKIKNTSKYKHSNKIWKQPVLLSISTFVQHHSSSEAFQVEYWLSALAIVCLSNQNVIPPRHFCGLLSHLILVFAEKSCPQRQLSWKHYISALSHSIPILALFLSLLFY